MKNDTKYLILVGICAILVIFFAGRFSVTYNKKLPTIENFDSSAIDSSLIDLSVKINKITLRQDSVIQNVKIKKNEIEIRYKHIDHFKFVTDDDELLRSVIDITTDLEGQLGVQGQ